MRKKLIISFANNPNLIDNLGFNYTAKIGDFPIVYDFGQDVVDFIYDVDNIEDTLSETIDTTLIYLRNNYSTPYIFYSRVLNTIEVYFNIETITEFVIGDLNSEITITTEDVAEVVSNLKYYFQYKNIIKETYLIQIFQKNFLGVATEINGKAIIEKSDVKDHLEPIRGTGLQIELEANSTVTLEDLYTQDEQEFTVKMYRNNSLMYTGFLKPDGVFQSYVQDAWVLNLDCIDGLGALKNLSFVKEDGYQFVGKLKLIDIIYNCLKRTGILLPINTSINTLYEGLISSDELDILTKTYMYSSRFIKTDDKTIMSCDEVLKSVLDIFCAVITQENGQWYIYKPNEIAYNSNITFRRYNIDNEYLNVKKVNIDKTIGSQIDNFYPHHCSGNQTIEIKGGVSGFRLGYKYGFVDGLLDNGQLNYDSDLNFPGWTINPAYASFLINDSLFPAGMKTHPEPFVAGAVGGQLKLLATSNVIPLDLDDVFTVKVSLKSNTSAIFYFVVSIGIYFLKFDGTWTTNPETWFRRAINGTSEDSSNFTSSFIEIKCNPLPITGDVTVKIYLPKHDASFTTSVGIAEIHSINLYDVVRDENKKGEFHTVQRGIRPSSIVKDNKTVFNGDNAGIVYEGAIFKEDQVTTTSKWYRRSVIESFPLLRIAAEEELRISQKPLKIFKGNLFGYLPYLSVIYINNINGRFMPIEYSYDTMTNILSLKNLELYSAELGDIQYTYTFDYGNTVKPTITS